MGLMLSCLLAIVCVIFLIAANLLTLIGLIGCSFDDIKESCYDLFEGRNAFGTAMSIFIIIMVIPGALVGLIFRLIYACLYGIWKLGKKKDFR